MRRLKSGALLGVGLVFFLVFLIAELPAAWLVSRLPALNQPLTDAEARLAGTMWRGQAQAKLQGHSVLVDWNLSPFCLFLGKGCFDLTLSLANASQRASFLQSSVELPIRRTDASCAGVPWVKVTSINGQLGSEIAQFLPPSVPRVEWPGDIFVNGVGFTLDFETPGVSDTTGTLFWQGSNITYWEQGARKSLTIEGLTLDLDSVDEGFSASLATGQGENTQVLAQASLTASRDVQVKIYRTMGVLLGFLPDRPGGGQAGKLYEETRALGALLCGFKM